MLINVKMPTIVGILTFMSKINFVLSWGWAWKKFYNLGPGLWTHICILLNNLLETQPNLIPSFSLIFKISSFMLEHEQRFYSLGQTPRYNTKFMLNSTEHEISYKLECWKTEGISCFQASNSKMMYKCIYHADSCHFNINEHDGFHAQFSWAWKKIRKFLPGLWTSIYILWNNLLETQPNLFLSVPPCTQSLQYQWILAHPPLPS